MFLSKINLDNTTIITKCVTHVQGLKCEIILDSHFNTVTVTGVGHKLCGHITFQKAARSLFKRFVQEVDSQDGQNIESQPLQTSNMIAQMQSQSVNVDEFASMNGIRPLFVSTPNCLNTDQVPFRQEMQSREQHADTYNDDISNRRKLSFMISKVCDLEAVVEDLKRSIIYTRQKKKNRKKKMQNYNQLRIVDNILILERNLL